MSPSSSTTHPRTKAVCGSFTHTYRLPEKSFSPSIPCTASAPDRISSDVIKDGANVVELGVVPLEFLRSCVPEGLMFTVGPNERDWCLVCRGLWEPDNGEGCIMDLGLPLCSGGPGDCDAVRVKGFPLLWDWSDAIERYGGEISVARRFNSL